MFRALKADKDSYVTDKYVSGYRAVSGNVGTAGSLDLFKLYGATVLVSGSDRTPQTELSRILIHFDIDPIVDLFNSNKIDISHSSFKCFLSLKDVYGGQTTPRNFTVDVFPLSSSFSEGLGRDVAYYSDEDKCNFLSASAESAWGEPGCAKPCFSTGSGDYITSSVYIADTKSSQVFLTGEEDLLVDVTKIVSSTIKGDLPDSGYRISFSSLEESNQQTYFVKRFCSRHAYDDSKRPKLIVKFDDSIQDDTSNLYLDSPTSSSVFLYNYVNGSLSNLVSSSVSVTGSNSLLLELQTQVSGVGTYSLFFTGSQHYVGFNPSAGIYSASVSLPLSNSNLSTNVKQSGSVSFTPIWSSLDKSVVFVTGSTIKAYPPVRTADILNPRRYTVSVTGISKDYSDDEDVTMRVNIFDMNSPVIMAKRLPFELPGVVVRNAYYAVRDDSTNEYVIPFDSQHNSTRLSSDSKGMYFKFNTSALSTTKSYVIDIMMLVDGLPQKYLDASPAFRIRKI